MRRHLRIAWFLWMVSLSITGSACLFGMDLAGDDDEVATSGEAAIDSSTSACGDDPLQVDDCQPNTSACLNAGEIRQCDAENTAETYTCAELCAPHGDFACVWAGPGNAGCWCVNAGPKRMFGCPELEDCLDRCSGPDESACQDLCFGKANNASVKVLGALFACASEVCLPGCEQQPSNCPACWRAARAEGAATCASERVICNADSADADIVTGGFPE